MSAAKPPLGGQFARAMWPGLWLSGLLAVLAFVLSFSALSAVGVASGIDPRLGWAFPLIIDGFILLATWAAWRFRQQGLRGAWYPWAAFVVFSAVSMTGNALHAHPVDVGGLLLARWAATAFSTVPSIALLVASHMLLMIATARAGTSVTAPCPAPGLMEGVEPKEVGSVVAPRKYPEELRERAIRLTVEARRDPVSRPGACKRIGAQLGINAETLRGWVIAAEAEADGPKRAPVSEHSARVAELEKENRELRRANEILRSASAFFAAELDRPRR